MGHSFTASYASGSVALLLSAFPSATPSELRASLEHGGASSTEMLKYLIGVERYASAKRTINECSDLTTTGQSPRKEQYKWAVELALAHVEYYLLRGMSDSMKAIETLNFLRANLPLAVIADFEERVNRLLVWAEVIEQASRGEIPLKWDTERVLSDVLGLRRHFLNRDEEYLLVFERDTRANPEDFEAWYDKGVALSRLERHQEAAAAWEQVVRLAPSTRQDWYFRARALYKLSRTEESLEAIKATTFHWPIDPEVWRVYGNVLQDYQKYQEALQAFEEALRLEPDDGLAWSSKADVLQRLEKTEETHIAWRLAHEAPWERPWRAPAGEARVSFEVDLLGASVAVARRNYLQALQMMGIPGNAPGKEAYSLFLCGTALAIQAEKEGREARLDVAAAAWRKALEVDKQLWLARYFLVEYLIRRGDVRTALDEIKWGLEAEPQDKVLGTLLINLLVANGQFAEAERYIDEVVKLQLNNVLLQSIPTQILLFLGKPVEALQAAQEAAFRAPLNIVLRLNVARILARLERLGEAEREYKTVLRIEPQLIDAYCELANILWTSGKFSEAIQQLMTAVALDEDAVEPQILLVRYYTEIGHPIEAEQQLKQLFSLGLREARIEFAAGTFYMQLGRLEEAERHLIGAVELDSKPEQENATNGLALHALCQIYRTQERSDVLTERLASLRRVNPDLANIIEEMPAETSRIDTAEGSSGDSS